jgi:hypothetical protein
MANLSPMQRAQFRGPRYITAVGSETGTRYKIYPQSVYNVYAHGLALCVAPVDDLSVWDMWLAQKLLIESNELHFLKTANIVRGGMWESGLPWRNPLPRRPRIPPRLRIP